MYIENELVVIEFFTSYLLPWIPFHFVGVFKVCVPREILVQEPIDLVIFLEYEPHIFRNLSFIGRFLSYVVLNDIRYYKETNSFVL